jgi:hypothetical protein
MDVGIGEPWKDASAMQSKNGCISPTDSESLHWPNCKNMPVLNSQRFVSGWDKHGYEFSHEATKA